MVDSYKKKKINCVMNQDGGIGAGENTVELIPMKTAHFNVVLSV